ncbi:long-chain-fatty-acid--CoA ligase [Corallococcus coralloides]|uniref:Long-chain-fatty-acid--CoA ligase n=1 Tax=Corallococcus coralloides TaxID=184914 RepID=A0A410RTV5_CORCK|nr:non-ribosomal peptide synthetase [Corallococcus coralloides]QAT85340.1 long-chain-fatty-acid--CoA ligase [Corallococcus coralloides]
MLGTDTAVSRWPLTAAQRGVWVAQKLDPSNPRYNCGAWLEIHGPVDVSLLRQAVQETVWESETLRVCFTETDDGPWQVLPPLGNVPLEVVDVSAEADPRQAAESWMRADLLRPVDLARAPLFHHAFFQAGPARGFFYVRYHHILMDGFGQTLHWRRVAQRYSALVGLPEEELPAFAPLSTLLEEESSYLASPQAGRDQRYWLDAFASPPEPGRLTTPATLASRGLLRRTAHLSPGMLEALRVAATREQTRWSVIAIAATAAYLHRMTGAEDVVLALPVTSRLTAASRATPCMLANELPLRLTVPAGSSLQALVRQVSSQVGRLLLHQRYRGEDLQHALRMKGHESSATGPVVNVVSFDHAVRFGPHATTAHYLSSGPVKDLLLGFYGRTDGSDVQLYLDANPELYSADDIAGHQRRFLAFLERFALAEPSQPVDRLDLLLDGERQHLVEGLNATKRPHDLTRPLHELIDAQARRTPDAVAAAVAGSALTYRELNARADRLAAHLRERGVTGGQHVGVCEERSLELVVGLLAILKAGGAYVPLDPELPRARLEFQVEDAGLRVVLTRSTLAARLEGLRVAALAVDTLLPTLPSPSAPLARTAGPEDTAYVIYTSGSTGQPKGVAVPHRGVVNRLLWMQDTYGLGPDDTVLQKTPFTFDVSVWEFFWPLLVGSRLFLAAPGGHKDPRYLARTIRDEAVTTLHFVPPMLDLFLAEPEAATVTGLRRVMCSGEALKPETVRAFFDTFPRERCGIGLHNLYGPTEASIDVTAWACSPGDAAGPIPIGRPVDNTAIYLLDRGGQLTPPGVPGELYIGGVQVARGYVNRPELTRERFVPDPFSSVPGARLYRTGDLARRRPDGAIDYLGRLDFQVKLRGFRIELGEIESVLLAHPALEQAVVTTWERTRGDRRLVAHVVAKPGVHVPAPRELTDFVARRLPEYMVPAHLLVLDALPLSSNGKIDRRALPAPVLESSGPGEAPTTPHEVRLHAVWKAVLGREHVGLDDSFFALGGDSMLSIRVRAALEKEGLTFHVQDLFRHPTLRELAKQLHPLDGTGHRREHAAPFSLLRDADRVRLPPGLEDAYPLSAMQAGMLFHAEFDDSTAVYRVVTSLHVGARFDEAALRGALTDTFRRHPALRSSFDLSTYSEPLQLVHPEVSVPLNVAEDWSRLDAEAVRATLQAWIDREKFRRFDPASPPLLAFTVHPRGENGFQLSVVEHHVVLDGWSDGAMLEEIVTRYRARLAGEELWLPAVASRYRDFVAEERRTVANPESRRFWTDMLQGVEPCLLPRLPTPPGSAPAPRQRAHEVPLPPQLAERLRLRAVAEALPLKSLLATAHVAVLRRVCGVDEVVTGVVSNGRLEEEGGDEAIGVFLNTLPLRVDTRTATLRDAAHAVFAHERESAPHRRYPYMRMQRDLGDALSLDSYVNFMDFRRQWKVAGPTGALILDGVGVAETNYPLAVNFLYDPVQGGLRLWLDCDESRLDADLCARLTGYYQRALEAVADLPGAGFADVTLVDAAERARVARWNDTSVTYDREQTVHALIEHQARVGGQRVALVHRGESVRYAQLDARANQLASLLKDRGVRRGGRVGVSLPRGPELVIALLAVMKAGAAYVPLDPGYPQNRLEFIASDADLDALVSLSTGPAGLPARAVVHLDTTDIASRPTAPVRVGADGHDTAYVLYTSGSTGRPKGTGVRHHNVVNFFLGMDARIGCGPEDSVLALTSVSFDISVLELLWPLTHGARVVIANEGLINNLVRAPGADGPEGDDAFAELCRHHAVTLTQSTPSFLAAVAAEPAALAALEGARAVLVGGEILPAGLVERVCTRLPRVRLFNMYGPTETTVWSTVHEVDAAKDPRQGVIPIGRPIANTDVLVLDAAREPTPIGVAGELWIGGEGVSLGYHHRPELTAERFVPHPARPGRMYRTGDRARWRPDGVLEFLGRVDRQVKIRGHRIEPDEVEGVLSRHPQVASVAVVAAARANGGAELVAFVSPGPGLLDKGAEDAHVRRWGEVWEDAYTDPETGARGQDLDRDFSGWLSSYTGEPIPPAQMREWLGHTVERVRALRPRTLVDVGVGVGLVLRHLAPHVERYLGLDVSAAALRTAAASLGSGPLPSHVTLVHGDAGHLSTLPADAGHTVVINSVIQYFPGTDYLTRVLDEAARVSGTTGAVFVGDVRDLELLEAFHASVQLHKAPALMPARDLAAAVARQVAAERELCLSPSFFREHAARLHRPVRLELKRGHAVNELTCFRYDVTLGHGVQDHVPAGGSVPWDTLPGDGDRSEGLAALLQARRGPFRVTGIPNRRLVKPLALVKLLHAATPSQTAWDVERALWDADETRAVDPEALAALAEAHGLTVRLEVPTSARTGTFDAVFEPKEQTR